MIFYIVCIYELLTTLNTLKHNNISKIKTFYLKSNESVPCFFFKYIVFFCMFYSSIASLVFHFCTTIANDYI